jgi:uncharacterized protein YndB with AHSA1/START domain
MRNRSVAQVSLGEDAMDEQRVERTTDLPLEQEEAWRVVTEPDELEQWLAPEVEIDLVEGGRVVVRERDAERHGTVVEVDPPRRWVFTWEDGGDRESTVEISLEPAREGTRVRVVEHAAERELALAA